jgi:hypothetical protein
MYAGVPAGAGSAGTNGSAGSAGTTGWTLETLPITSIAGVAYANIDKVIGVDIETATTVAGAG